MAQKRIVILGCTGMLGSMLLDFFAKNSEFDLVATYRNPKDVKLLKIKYPKVDFRRFDAEKASLKSISELTKNVQWLINAIGVIKPYIHDDNPIEVQNAINVNSLFPHLLASAAKKTGFKVIQIATDCVYSGQKGNYIETDPHDSLDVYGKTKSLGEVFGDEVYHLRCSIIGPELKGHKSLMDWFLNQPKGAEVNGFTNHEWNGVTTLHYSRICHGIIKEEVDLPRIQHIIPGNLITKADLLKSIAQEFKRDDIVIKNMEASTAIDRTLSTNNQKLNQKLWKLAGFDNPPTIEKMIEELSKSYFFTKDKKI